MRRIKLAGAAAASVLAAVVLYVWIASSLKGKAVDRCFDVTLGMSREELRAVMKEPGVESRESGSTSVTYPVPAWFDTQPTVRIDDKTGKVIEVVCSESHRLK